MTVASTMNVEPVPLGQLLQRSTETVRLSSEGEYSEVTVRLNGNGAKLRRKVRGAEIASESRYLARAGQLILSRIDARHGAVALLPDSLDGAVVTNDFPLFDFNIERVIPEYLSLVIKAEEFVELCKRASKGSTNRVRIKEDLFLALTIPLPVLHEQRRIVAKVEEAMGGLDRAAALHAQTVADFDRLLMAVAIGRGMFAAPKSKLIEVAPLDRRIATIKFDQTYQEIACRSFGRGLFEKPLFDGAAATWQRPNIVRSGDVLLSNIKAWEGAIAVVTPEHDGKLVSHRYLTLSCVPSRLVPEYLCLYLLSPEGLDFVGAASPGTADRNRTLNVKKLHEIPVPVPPMSDQLVLTAILEAKATFAARDTFQKDADALRRSILSRAFRGEL